MNRTGSHVTRGRSSPVLFSTDMSPEISVAPGNSLGDTRDLVLVSLILVMWAVVILLFLHRWGNIFIIFSLFSTYIGF